MATPDQRVPSRVQNPATGQTGCGAPPGRLDNLECKETQELAPAELAMLRKAHEFFQTCDVEGKGFIARRDMQVRGTQAGPAHLECQMAWASLSQVRTCATGGDVFNRKDAIKSVLERGISPSSTGSQISWVLSCSGLYLLSYSGGISPL